MNDPYYGNHPYVMNDADEDANDGDEDKKDDFKMPDLGDGEDNEGGTEGELDDPEVEFEDEDSEE